MLPSQVDNPTSLENVESKVHAPLLPMVPSQLNFFGQWIDEIIEYCPGVKVCDDFCISPVAN